MNSQTNNQVVSGQAVSVTPVTSAVSTVPATSSTPATQVSPVVPKVGAAVQPQAQVQSQSQAQSTVPAGVQPLAVKMPVFQASAAGGMVATLRPGQTTFEGQIRAESDRRSGHADVNVSQLGEKREQPAEVAAVKLQQSADASYLGVQSKPKVVAKPQEAPKSVRNFKVGAEKEERKPINWVLILVVAGLAVILALVAFLYLRQRKEEAPAPEPKTEDSVILNYWGLWEPTATFTKVLSDFSQENPGVSVIYEKQNINGYRERLEEAIKTANGPDVFRYHASWRGMLEPNLSVMPSDLMSTSEYANTFYPVANEQLTNEYGRIQGMPLMYDSLAIIYNKEIFDSAGLKVPETWLEFGQTATALTIKEDDYIVQSGAAFGLGSNVDFASDIVMLLALQNGMDPKAYSEDQLRAALEYYTGFYTDETRRVWDLTFDNSTLEFARGNVAMIIGPSWLIHDITKINPTLQVGVASIPQLDQERPVEWASYYAEGVNANASEQQQLAAWRLLEYLSRPSVLEALYLEQAELRRFGEIYPRRDMADLLAADEMAQPYLAGAENATNLPLNDKTFDEAVNDEARAKLLTEIYALTGEKEVRGGELVGRAIRTALYQYGYADNPENDE